MIVVVRVLELALAPSAMLLPPPLPDDEFPFPTTVSSNALFDVSYQFNEIKMSEIKIEIMTK